MGFLVSPRLTYLQVQSTIKLAPRVFFLEARSTCMWMLSLCIGHSSLTVTFSHSFVRLADSSRSLFWSKQQQSSLYHFGPHRQGSPIFRVSLWMYPEPTKESRRYCLIQYMGRLTLLSLKLQLLPCKVSGDSSLSTTFQARLPKFLCPLGDQPRENSVMFTFANAMHLVYKRKRIHHIQLSTHISTNCHTRRLIQLAQHFSSYLMGYEFPGCHYTVPNHPFIVQYLKGEFNCCKSTPRHQERCTSTRKDYVFANVE